MVFAFVICILIVLLACNLPTVNIVAALTIVCSQLLVLLKSCSRHWACM